MALDSVLQSPDTSDERLAELNRLLASICSDADPSATTAAAADIHEALTARRPVPGWERFLVVGWQSAPDGVRLARRAIRFALHEHGLPPTGEVFSATFELALKAY